MNRTEHSEANKLSKRNIFWAAIAAVASAVSTAVAILTYMAPDKATQVKVNPIHITSEVRSSPSDKFGMELLRAKIAYGAPFDTYEFYFFGLATRMVPGGYSYALDTIFNKYDDAVYQNCRGIVAGYGKTYVGGLHVSSLKGIASPEMVNIDLKRGRYEERFTLITKNKIDPIDMLSAAEFSIACDGMIAPPILITIK